jgi:hypothetical protein
MECGANSVESLDVVAFQRMVEPEEMESGFTSLPHTPTYAMRTRTWFGLESFGIDLSSKRASLGPYKTIDGFCISLMFVDVLILTRP